MKKFIFPVFLLAGLLGGCHKTSINQPHNNSEAKSLNSPDCSGVNNWPTAMAFVTLKNRGYLENEFGPDKTKTFRIASEFIENGIYRQVHLTKFEGKHKKVVTVITICNVSHEECSESDVDVILVDKMFFPDESIVSMLMKDKDS